MAASRIGVGGQAAARTFDLFKNEYVANLELQCRRLCLQRQDTAGMKTAGTETCATGPTGEEMNLARRMKRYVRKLFGGWTFPDGITGQVRAIMGRASHYLTRK